MNPHIPQKTDIASLLEHELILVCALSQLLERETEALRQRDPQALQGLIHEKLDVVQRLEQLSQCRQKWLGHTASADMWRQWLAAHSEGDHQLIDTWQEIEQRAIACRELNTINEKVLMRTRQTANRLLGLLRGEPTENSVYTALGHSAGGYRPQRTGIMA